MISDPYMFWKYRISTGFMLAFMLEFMPLRYSRRKSFWICVGCFALTTAVSLIYSMIYLPDAQPLERIAFLDTLSVLVLATAIILSRYRDWRAIFVAASASAEVLPGGMLWNVTVMLTGNFSLAFAVEILVDALYLYLFVRELRASFLAEAEHAEEHWFNLCLIPTFFYLLVYTTVMPDENSYSHLSVNIEAVLCLIGLMVASFVFMVRSFETRNREIQLCHENMMMKQYAIAVRHEAESMRQKEEKHAIIRHDLRHLNNMMRAYLDAGEIDKAKGMLTALDSRLDETVTRHYCENVAVNGILLSSAERARRLGVNLECHTEVPDHLEHVDGYDLGAVIANLVENAITAASDQRIPEQQRIVRIEMHMVKAQLAMSIENPYAGELAIDPRTGLPLSHAGEMHGYGLRSVQLFAEKSNSIFRYTAENHVFRVNLLVSC